MSAEISTWLNLKRRKTSEAASRDRSDFVSFVDLPFCLQTLLAVPRNQTIPEKWGGGKTYY